MRSFFWNAGAFLLLAAAFGCNGGGGSADTGSFKILSTNVISGQSWPINGPIEMHFNKPVDISTVSFATITVTPAPPASVLAPAAGPAQGIFFAKAGSDGNTIVFQPSCPTDAGNQTGGLLPGNIFGSVVYTLAVLGGSQGGQPGVRAQDGSKLGNSYAVTFQTLKDHPFLDPVPQNPPKPAASVVFPASLGLNLAIAPNDPIVFALDQPVQAATVDNQAVRLEFTNSQTGVVTPIPAQVSLTANCNESAQAVFSIVPLGVFPPGETVRAYLSKNLQGLGEYDQHPVDYLLFSAVVSPVLGVPQLDAFLEEFDDASHADSEIADPVALAAWSGGRLDAAPLFFGKDNGIEIEIGPGTQNGENAVLSTTSGALKDKNGASVLFDNGIIECSRFLLKTPLAGKSSTLRGTGPNPLVIRAFQSITIESGSLISVDGQPGVDVTGLGTPNLPAVPGSGNCGGGTGGPGSPVTDKSDAKGGDGNGAFEVPKTGGMGGHSGYGNTGDIKNRPGGGGGGDWGVFELDGAGNYVAFCYHTTTCTIPGCPQPLLGCGQDLINCKLGVSPVPTTHGEDGALGVITALDAFTGVAPPQGGSKGPAVFQDGTPQNDFFGRKPMGDGSILSGELKGFQGGEGAGGGGDSVAGPNFPSNDFMQKDTKGAGGGGGAGVLVLQSLGPVVVRGTLSANGGQGAIGEEAIAGSISGAGGGGGAGGMISIQSANQVVMGVSASVSARGGQRGAGGGAHPDAPGNCASGNECIKNCTASRGGAGGKGVVSVSVPFEGSSTLSCGGALLRKIQDNALIVELDAQGTPQKIFCERDPLFTARFAPNNPHVLVPEFGAKSGARSRWYSTGWASVAGTPSFSFAGADGAGVLDASVETVLAAGFGAAILSENRVTITSAPLAAALQSSPKTLIEDGFRAQAGGALLRIVNASIAGNEITVETDPKQGAIPVVQSWQIVRRSFEALSDGVFPSFPAGANVKVLFEGANELAPGTHQPDLSAGSLVGPTANLGALLGKKLIRFSVNFDRPLSGPTPGIGFLKIGTSF